MIFFKNLVAGSCLAVVVSLSFFAGLEAWGNEGSLEITQVEASQVVGEVAIPYVTALQTGDVQTLERLIDGPLAVTLGTLLRDNQDYPNFLRGKFGKNRLLDTESILEQKVSEGFVILDNEKGSGTITVEMSRSDNSPMSLQLSFDKLKTGNWKVVNQKVIR